MNFKKFLLASTACVALVATLTSCKGGSVVVTYTDAEGKVVTQNVTATKDSDEVSKSLNSLVEKQYEVKTADIYSASVSADVTLKGTASEQAIDAKAKLSVNAVSNVPEIKEDSTVESLLTATNEYVEITAEISGIPPKNTTATTTVDDVNKVAVELFAGEGNVYLDVTELKLPLLSSLPAGEGMTGMILPMISTVVTNLNGKTVKLNYQTLIGMLSLTGTRVDETKINAEIQKLAKQQKDGTLTFVPADLLGSKVTKENLNTEIAKFVKNNLVEISGVSGNNVTFKMTLDMAKASAPKDTTTSTTVESPATGKVELEVTVNVVDLSFANVKVNAKDVKIKNTIADITVNGSVEVKFEKGGTIKKISDEKKTNAKTLDEVLGGLIGGGASAAPKQSE